MEADGPAVEKKSVFYTEAIELICSSVQTLPAVPVPVSRVDGCILGEDLLSNDSSPPFDRSAMDGYAVRTDELLEGKGEFQIVGVRKAGEAEVVVAAPGQVLKIMTGASVPQPFDAVVPVEDATVLDDSTVLLKPGKISRYMNVARKGESAKPGDLIVPSGTQISPTLSGLLSSLRYESVAVRMLPPVSIVVTGKEVGEDPSLNGIGDFNGPALQNLIRSSMRKNIQVRLENAPDDRDQLKEILENALHTSGLLIVTGGISKGDTDYVPHVLQELGVRFLFRGVKMKPGKPVLAGMSEKSIPVLALPGNPVSSIIGFRLFGIAMIQSLLGMPREKKMFFTAGDSMVGKEGTDFFIPVRLEAKDGPGICVPISYRGSGDLISVGRADGFVRIPADRGTVARGETVEFFFWDFVFSRL